MKVKIRVNDEIAVSAKMTSKSTTPAGATYWVIDYLIDAGGQLMCVHSATTGAIFGAPNPIDTLDREYTITEYHYQDIPNPDPQPTDYHRDGRVIKAGTSGGRPAWWEEIAKTHRQAIIDKYAQLIIE